VRTLEKQSVSAIKNGWFESPEILAGDFGNEFRKA